MKYKLVLFDLDGTLVNTLEAISKIINMTLKEIELPINSLEENQKLIGHGIQGIVEKIFEKNNMTLKKEEVFQKLKKYYEKHFNYNVKIYNEVDKLLDFLVEKNIKFGIVTNKEHDLAIKTVEKNLFKWNFIEIIGADDSKYPKKPNPYIINKIIKENKINKNEVLFVGDMLVDVETAKNADIDIAYCNWGFGSSKNEKVDEKIKINNVEELINRIKG